MIIDIVRSNFKIIIFGFIFTFFSCVGQSFFIGLFNSNIRAELNISHGEFGTIYGIATLCSSLTLIWLGKKIDDLKLINYSFFVVIFLSLAALFFSFINGPRLFQERFRFGRLNFKCIIRFGCITIRRSAFCALVIPVWARMTFRFGAFWNNATESTSAFKDAGVIIGQTWDTTGLLLNQENPDYKFRAPKEGIITWLDSCGLTAGAENIDEAYEFINFIYTPEIGGMFANNTGYNSAVAGSDAFTSDTYKRQFTEVYTSDVLGNMWWWQADTPWFGPVRNKYVDIISNA